MAAQPSGLIRLGKRTESGQVVPLQMR